MMDFSLKIMIALLLISQPAGGHPSNDRAAEQRKTSKPDETNKKENDKNVIRHATDLNSNLEWVRSAEVPKDAVTVKDDKMYYVTKKENCEPCFFDSDTKSCVTWLPGKGMKDRSDVTYDKIMFLVNKDNFEMMEWKKCSNQKIPLMPVEACDDFFIAKNAFGFTTMTANDLMKKLDVTPEVLTLNTDIKMQHLNVVEYLMSSVVMSENLEVLKHFQVSNKNCKPAKHTVELDQNIDKTTSYQIDKKHEFGVHPEISFNVPINSIINIGVKLGFKYDHSRARSNTTSVLEKTLHSVSMEVEVPPNHSCIIDITSNTFNAEVPFTGEITRMYNNNEIRKTFINGTYIHQEVAEIQTLVNPCQPLTNVRKCVSTQT